MRAIGAMVVGVAIFFAVVAAMSRILEAPTEAERKAGRVPLADMIENTTAAIANLFRGVFQQ